MLAYVNKLFNLLRYTIIVYTILCSVHNNCRLLLVSRQLVVFKFNGIVLTHKHLNSTHNV